MLFKYVYNNTFINFHRTDVSCFSEHESELLITKLGKTAGIDILFSWTTCPWNRELAICLLHQMSSRANA